MRNYNALLSVEGLRNGLSYDANPVYVPSDHPEFEIMRDAFARFILAEIDRIKIELSNYGMSVD